MAKKKMMLETALKATITGIVNKTNGKNKDKMSPQVLRQVRIWQRICKEMTLHHSHIVNGFYDAASIFCDYDSVNLVKVLNSKRRGDNNSLVRQITINLIKKWQKYLKREKSVKLTKRGDGKKINNVLPVVEVEN